ncbi:addiction module toxin, RelE/StbE family [Burkholderia sp. WP9]|uniref:type II toxin-antitoxin system RelE/ParE family toxin n=1 Tax=Burkholderia sp. WP9 TaxID=1500263 RepID=UPI0008950F1B|nr:type II toxin-antitoxin system RelE/ParE family toxin [Burkholderia sp. WP9]SEF11629.1 addiction module toxin, RelE/StbE family [Burkholderia sp. WP9]
MRIEWQPAALINLADILDAITEESPQGAANLSADIQSKAVRLETNPKLYRAGRVRGTRECVITENYLLIYRITGDVVQILRVLHARQQWPTSE